MDTIQLFQLLLFFQVLRQHLCAMLKTNHFTQFKYDAFFSSQSLFIVIAFLVCHFHQNKILEFVTVRLCCKLRAKPADRIETMAVFTYIFNDNAMPKPHTYLEYATFKVKWQV